MLAPVTEALHSFRRRIRLAAFARGAAWGFFLATAVLVGLLLLVRILGEQALPAELVGLLFAPPAWLGGAWCFWLLASLMALAAGSVAAMRLAISDREALEHLEQRLATDGLLLAAADGVELEGAWRAQLSDHLRRVPSVLPVVRWRALIWRPLAAAGMLLLLQGWAVPPRPAPRGEAIQLAVDRLAVQVEELADLSPVPEISTEELRRSVAELQQRVEDADVEAWREVLWREVDQLQDRLDRERRLAMGVAGDRGSSAKQGGIAGNDPQGQGGDASARGGVGSREAPGKEQLAEAMKRLLATDNTALDKVVANLPEDLREGFAEAVASAVQDSGDPDPQTPDPQTSDPQTSGGLPENGPLEALLPEDAESRAAIAQALSEAARETAQELAEGVPTDEQKQMQADLTQLAEDLLAGEESPGELANAGDEALAEGLAKAAAELAQSGALDQLPAGLQKAMAEAAMGALESFDLEMLQSLLPSDPEQLRGLADAVAQLAEGAGAPEGEGQQQPPTGVGGEPPELSLSPEKRRELLALAQDLRERMGSAGEGGQPEAGPDLSQAGGAGASAQPVAGSESGAGGQPGAGEPGSAGQPGSAGEAGRPPGAGVQPEGEDAGTGGGHAALRLTEDARGGVGAAEFELPGVDPAELPGDWLPSKVEKAAPELASGAVGQRARSGQPAGNQPGKKPSEKSAGKATWKLRLMPRHRDVVRRFFAEKNK